jgi:spore germination protein KC
MKSVACFLTVLTCMILLSGCWDYMDLERRTSVLAIGIDRDKSNPKHYLVTIQIPIPKSIMGGKGGTKGEQAVSVMSATGTTLNEAVSNMQKRLNQTEFYGHTRIVVFSEEVAREGLGNLLDALRRDPQIRRLLWPMVVKGSAKELLLANPKIEQIPTVFIVDLFQSGVKRGLYPNITLGEFYNDVSDTSAEAGMNYVEGKGAEFKWRGFAVFNKDRMIGILDDKEVWSLLQLREEKVAGEIDVPCSSSTPGKEKKFITYRPKTIRVKKSFTPKGDSFQAVYNVRLEGDIIESQCDIDFTKISNIERLQKELAQQMESSAKLLISKLQKKLQVDELKLGSYARGKAPDWWDAEKWKKSFPEGEIKVSYDVNIRRTGMEMK